MDVPVPRICKDIASKEGKEKFLKTPLWPQGPTWNDLPGMAKPDLPSEETDRVWDAWLTDFNPEFWQHLFGDCPLNHGKDLCSSQEGKDLYSSPTDTRVAHSSKDLVPRCSWITYHGTSITSALTAVSMKWINRNEKVHGHPAQNDTKHPRASQDTPKEYGEGTWETNAGHGIYTATECKKARDYAVPYVARGRGLLGAISWQRSRHDSRRGLARRGMDSARSYLEYGGSERRTASAG